MENYKIGNETINEETKKIINQFLLILNVAKKSPISIKKHKKVLERFFEKVNVPIDRLESNDIFEYILNNYTEYDAVTIRSYLNILSKFFKFCKDRDYIYEGTVLIKKRWIPRLPQTDLLFIPEDYTM